MDEINYNSDDNKHNFFDYNFNSKASKNTSYEKSMFGKEKLYSNFDFDDYFLKQYKSHFNEINELENKLRNYPDKVSSYLDRLNKKEVELEEIIRNDLPFVPKYIIEHFSLERNKKGEITLYHATPSMYIDEIFQNGLMPPKNTGNSVWRMSHEDDRLKLSKIYLATKNRIIDIAGHIQSYQDGKEISILETKVSEKKLYPDEDSHKYSWIGSLDELGTCAHRGVITPEKIDVIETLEKYEINESNKKFKFRYY